MQKCFHTPIFFFHTYPDLEKTKIKFEAFPDYTGTVKLSPNNVVDIISVLMALPSSPGRLPFELCQLYVEQIVLVNDDDIKAAVSTLYRAGLVVEPSGSAAFAALVNNKIPDLEGKNVVCILSGGNVGKDELSNFPD
ncbi:hypothetical protein ATANTOWER_001755 [Ataeniobius toweri]|uniref:L-serine deaminase n=1 Tax=Ataeniobius toweri TaxID=208326 RepID=A0ABU7BE03_9TELE|nr:hypothetical protein [Ataeniobius toweri]